MNSYEDIGRTPTNPTTGGSGPDRNTAPTPYPAPPHQQTVGQASAGDGRQRRWTRVVAGAAVAVVLAGGAAGIGGASAYLLTGHRAAAAESTASTTRATSVADTTTVAGVIAKVKAQVVSIAVTGATTRDQGSGIVVRSDGTILTNNHVISAATDGGTITVTFSDGSTAPATVLAASAGKDLALIKADGVANLSTAALGDSGAVRVGETVIAIGNELGLPGSVSQGIVSGLHRTLTAGDAAGSPNATTTTYSDAIQTDAATNPGDSGGALFNTAGKVIGVNTAIATADGSSSGSIGVGFAIPSNDVASFLNETLGES